MNSIPEYLNLEIPENWKSDQQSWRLSDSVSNSFRSAFINKWIQENNHFNMERSNIDIGNSQLNYLKLNLRQINSQIKNLVLHLTTLSQLEESDQILEK